MSALFHIELGVQVPDWQVPPGQVVPFGLLPLTMHCWAPFTHWITPVWQTLDGWQAPPPTQVATQVPAIQTWPAPHAWPSDTFVPVSWQTDCPFWQVQVPVWQRLTGMQEPLVVQPVGVAETSDEYA